MRFAILTAVRRDEARLADWDEIDLAAGLWSIPPDRMKARKAHVVPLTPQACDVLREAEKFRDGPFVFTGDVEMAEGGRHPISEAAMLMALRSHHPTATLHGMRSSFKDWSVEQTEFDNALSEMALAHRVRFRRRTGLSALGSARAAPSAHGRLGELHRALRGGQLVNLKGRRHA